MTEADHRGSTIQVQRSRSGGRGPAIAIWTAEVREAEVDQPTSRGPNTDQGPVTARPPGAATGPWSVF
ncbi:hypothetical protein, partial [Streptomyces caniscabiei]|uniref:hypothetical protein n=1 Tax=Streptomyces caniscabiei TaxID=2746961 RepID=UPI001C4FA703